jgi:nitrous oxidase accessory protein NosD
MVQGILKSKRKAAKSASASKHKPKAKVKKGQPTQAPQNATTRAQHEEALVVTKAINKRNETMAAARAVQGGGKLQATDLKARGKETVKDMRRSALTRKKSKLELTLNKLKQAEER